MNLIQRVEHWGDRHHPKWLDLLRIALGLFLCLKGIEFANNMSRLENLMTSQVPFSSLVIILLAHYVLFAHLMGGFLLMLGLLTRFACLIQIPILLGAIIFIRSSDMFHQFSEVSLSIIVLLLLVYFLIIGSGRWSLDWYMDKEPQKPAKEIKP
jgi:putative oxidoreductase